MERVVEYQMHTAFNSVREHTCSFNELSELPRVNYLTTGGVRSEKPLGDLLQNLTPSYRGWLGLQRLNGFSR
jgi:hypothetical protein